MLVLVLVANITGSIRMIKEKIFQTFCSASANLLTVPNVLLVKYRYNKMCIVFLKFNFDQDHIFP